MDCISKDFKGGLQKKLMYEQIPPKNNSRSAITSYLTYTLAISQSQNPILKASNKQQATSNKQQVEIHERKRKQKTT